jgi:hypothetical protein
MAIELGTKTVEVVYNFPIDAKTQTVLEHSLIVGGEDLKEGDPRVFVIDLTGDSVAYTPLNVELPNDAPNVAAAPSEEWGTIVQRAVEQLKDESTELQKLLDVRK